MGDVNIQLVREFFELSMFQLLTYWPQRHARAAASEHGVILFARNTAAAMPGEPEFLLRAADLRHIGAAMIDVRAWHADRFYPSVVESSPVLRQIVEPETVQLGREVFGHEDFTSILVISDLPNTPEPRTRALHLFQEAGIGHIIEFPTVLRSLLDKVSESGSYAASETLQVLRLLKRYQLVRHHQMEFAFPTEPPPPLAPVAVEASEAPSEDGDD